MMEVANEQKILNHVFVRPVEAHEVPRWLQTMREHHYLGFGKSAGKRILYVATFEDKWVALLSWSAAALHVRCRDQWIGWDQTVKRRRLRHVTNNSRFLVLPGIAVKNLASKALALNIKRLREDWLDQHGYEVLLAETFVDPERYRGTCYLAQGWRSLGQTEGFGHDPRGSYTYHGKPKLVFVRELVSNATYHLRSALFSEHKTTKVVTDVTKLPLNDLVEHMRQLPRVRVRSGYLYTEAKLLALSACALLSGATGYRAIARYAENLNEQTIERLGIKTNKRPTLSILWRLLKRVDAEQFDRHIVAWFRQVHRSVAMQEILDSYENAKPLPLLSGIHKAQSEKRLNREPSAGV
jgi:hypothetical protein